MPESVRRPNDELRGTLPERQTAGCANLPGRVVLGIGAASREDGTGVEDFIRAMMSRLGIEQVDAIATLRKTAMPLFLPRLAENFGNVPLLVYGAARLERETPRLACPSSLVYRAVGCHGVAEAAALCAAGAGACLVLEKTACKRVTIALAQGCRP